MQARLLATEEGTTVQAELDRVDTVNARPRGVDPENDASMLALAMDLTEKAEPAGWLSECDQEWIDQELM